jgi:hypothetical protein
VFSSGIGLLIIKSGTTLLHLVDSEEPRDEVFEV